MEERLNEHQKDYKQKAWQNYSLEELGNWIYLFSKRANHRSNIMKTKKDLHDAKNYLLMMEEKLKQQTIELEISWDEI